MKPISKAMRAIGVMAVACGVGLPGLAAVNDLPWQESFEGYTSGQSLNGINGWALSGSGGVVATNFSYTFTGSGLPLATNHTKVLDRWGDVTLDVTSATATNAWCDMMIYAGQRWDLSTNVLDATVKTAFAVDTNGLLNVWHQTDINHDGVLDGAGWTALNNTPLAVEEWARITLEMDNTSDTIHSYRYVRIRLNGYVMTNAAAFTLPDGSLVSGGAWFIMGGSGAPAVDSLEIEGYGKSDDIVLQYGNTWPMPVAANDTAAAIEGIAATIAPLSNDTDPDGDALALASFTQPGHGTTASGGANQISYTATAGFVGTDTFTYVVSDVHGFQSTGTVEVAVSSRPPVAVDDAAAAAEGVAATLSPLANDSDPAGDVISLVSFTQPSHGVVTAAGGNQVNYTATAGYVGSDSFTYTITDPYGNQATATVTVEVSSRPPIAVSDSVIATQGVAVVVSPLANDSDPSGDTISLHSFMAPSHGSVTDLGGNLVQYLPEGSYTGADTFQYVIADSHGMLATGTVNVTVMVFVSNPLPWRESFEPYHAGMSVYGTNGWSGTGDALMTNMIYASDQNYPLLTVTHTQTLDRTGNATVLVTESASTNIFCDMMIGPRYRFDVATTVLDVAVRVAAAVDTNGYFNIWHETDADKDGVRDGGKWTILNNSPLVLDDWARLTMIMDNTSDTLLHHHYVQVYVNGTLMTHADAYQRPDGALQAGGSWFIMGGTNTPAIQSIEFNGYGLSDDLVVGYGVPKLYGGAVYLIR